jgi:predicted phage tail protein
MKTEIKLYGKLAKQFGSVYKFANIKKGVDAVSAINSIQKDFRQTILSHYKDGQHYEIIVNGKSLDAFEANKAKSKIKTVEIVPCILGRDPISLFIVGGLSTAAGLGAFGAVSSAMASFFITLGLGLIMAGITYLLTPIPENKPKRQEATVKGESFLFQGANNVTEQGTPVPLAYGRLRIGSKVIQTSIRNGDINVRENPYQNPDSDFFDGTADEYEQYLFEQQKILLLAAITRMRV